MELLVTPQEIINAADGPVCSVNDMVKLSGGTLTKNKIYDSLKNDKTASPRYFLNRIIYVETSKFAEWFCTRLELLNPPD